MTKKQDQKEPKLRFPGFSERWEKKQLGSLGVFKNGINKGKNDFGFGVPFVNLMDVFGKYFIDSNIVLGLVNANEKEIQAYSLRQGDILFIRSSVKLSGVGETIIILEDLLNTVFSGFLIRFRENCGLLSVPFMRHCFWTRRFRKNLISLSTTSANTNINQESLKLVEVIFPKIDEQIIIASFLSSVDTKIEQLGKKKSLLEQYKKGIMQKLFSQELRFKDEQENDFPDWEEKMLGNVIDYEQPTKYLVASTEYSDSHSIPVLTAGKTFLLGFTNETSGIFKENLPTIIFDDFTTAFQYVNFPFKAKSSAMKMLVPKNDSVNIKYIFEAMKRIRFPLGEHKRYWISEYQKEKIPYPHPKEQRKIADFLSAIDKKIGLVNMGLEKAQTFKKGLLQQMFI